MSDINQIIKEALPLKLEYIILLKMIKLVQFLETIR
jgi:hypothetical protein